MSLLCDRCKEIFERPRDSRWHLHHATNDSFKEAVAAGCYMCRALASEIKLRSGTLSDLNITALTNYCIGSSVSFDRLPVFLNWDGDEHDDCQRKFELFRLDTVRNALPCTSDDRTLPARSYLNTAKRWISECQEHHSACRKLHAWKNMTNRYTPKRLVAIGDGDPNTWHLVMRDGSDHLVRQYATLSHRWSESPTVKLLLSNLESFPMQQSISDLPASFRDAITVALELGIKHIWIDCLCIIQDSYQDWKEQGMEMCNIYTNAVVNISATGVANNTYSFLQAYDDKPIPTPPIVRNVSQSLTKGKQGRPTNPPRSTSEEARDAGGGDWCVVDPFFWWSEVTNTVLLSRGWVFQERYLAPRVLHFGAQQLLWECTTMDACETYPHGLPDYVKKNGHTDLKRLKVNDTVLATADQPAPGLAPPPTDASLQVWCDLVEAYTRTNLTKENDKLFALFGVSQLVRRLYHGAEGENTNDGDWAGIFERHLLPMLEWHTDDTRAPQVARPREYRAPTWSWASVDGRVFYNFLPHLLSNWTQLAWPTFWERYLRYLKYRCKREYHVILPSQSRQQGSDWRPLVWDVVLGATELSGTQDGQVSKTYSIKLTGHLLDLKSLLRRARERRRRHPILVTEDTQYTVFMSDADDGGEPIDRKCHDRVGLPLRCLELLGEDSRLMYWVIGLVLKSDQQRESVYSRCGFFAVLSTEAVQEMGIRIYGSGSFKAEYVEGLELSSIEIV
ncbi:hypothetical protein PG995_004014 [Apiospora arundinis]|uniref:Heterokaryon incompatibility protein-domain-containing protein n=1 Tax=Apiospora arundinis TaxID=335852 RepID=A0ABR2HQI9_9PEZI